jgi:hypothetical protein
MKAISVYDLKRIPALSHLTYFDLVHPDNDKLVNPYLHDIGFNLNKGLSYTVSQHRTLANTVEIGFVIRGEVRTDREFLNSSLATLEDKMAAAALTDMSLCAELCRMMNQASSIGAYSSATRDGEPDTDFPESLTNPDEAEIVSKIRQLEQILDDIRGSQHKEDGSLKLPEDYQKQPDMKLARKTIRRHKEVLTNLRIGKLDD